MGVAATHLPLTNLKKSSPGLTVRSIPSRSTPHVPYRCAVVAGVVVVDAASAAYADVNVNAASSAIAETLRLNVIKTPLAVWVDVLGRNAMQNSAGPDQYFQ